MSVPAVLPRTRTGRRRLPRPPRFTRRQKIALAWDLTMIAIDVASGIVLTPGGFLIVCGLACDARVIIRCALQRRDRARLAEMTLPLSLWLTGLAALWTL